MSRFTGPLVVSYYTSEDSDVPKDVGRIAVLYEPLTWECDYLGSGLIVTIEKGFVSDGGTIPRIWWGVFPPWGDIRTRATILHDYLTTKRKNGVPIVGCETRAACDWQFYLALKALGSSEFDARFHWLIVRLGSLTVFAKD